MPEKSSARNTRENPDQNRIPADQLETDLEPVRFPTQIDTDAFASAQGTVAYENHSFVITRKDAAAGVMFGMFGSVLVPGTEIMRFTLDDVESCSVKKGPFKLKYLKLNLYDGHYVSFGLNGELLESFLELFGEAGIPRR